MLVVRIQYHKQLNHISHIQFINIHFYTVNNERNY